MIIMLDNINDNNVFDYGAHEEYSCGASACRMALKQIGIDKSEKELIKLLGTNGEVGTPVNAFAKLYDDLGLAYVSMRNATIEDLHNFFDTGWTIIVRYYMPQYEADHYTVIQNIGNESIDLHDPFYGNNTMSLKNFNELWGVDKGLGNVPHWFVGVKNKPYLIGLEKDNTAESEPLLKKAIEHIYNNANVKTEYDIPFIAGYSDNGKNIYIDCDIPETEIISGKEINLHYFLVFHESIEKSLIDQLGIDYVSAHQIALRAEQAAIDSYGINWKEYDNYYNKKMKEVRAKEFKSIPKDLDLTPYEQEATIYSQDKEILDKIKEVM